jgi:hypothetical protein
MVNKAGPRLTRSGVVDVDNPGGESVRWGLRQACGARLHY